MQNEVGKKFTWESLGDIETGRGNLGLEMPVMVYRLLQYTMMDVISHDAGIEKANKYFYAAGYVAGTEFSKHALDLTLEFNAFIVHLQEVLKELKVGILRMEFFDPETGDIVLTVGEDLDCSGLPVTDENICIYDEGFISGILEQYTGKKYEVKEVDCWGTGDRVCRFEGKQANSR